MHLSDNVYGEITLKEPVLAELLQSAPVQRLKKIMQSGAYTYVSPEHNLTRYTHSVGVMLLLRTKGASLEEQCAGLLHDVGHGAFSHVIDVVLPQYNHNYDDAFFEQTITKSDIPIILEKHEISVKRVLEKDHFSMLEQPLPNLCGDRIDYTLHQTYGKTPALVQKIVNNLTTHHGVFAFNKVESAYEFTQLYEKLNREIWMDPRAMASYEILARALKEGIDSKIITEEDFRLTDEVVLNKLRHARNPTINNWLQLLTPSLRVTTESKKPDFVHIAKNRWVDPQIITGKTTKRVSDYYPELKQPMEYYHTHRTVKYGISIAKTTQHPQPFLTPKN
jgi:HD superfamily phosphohydrolase